MLIFAHDVCLLYHIHHCAHIACARFIGAPEEDDTLSSIDAISHYLDGREAVVVVAALRALSLLTSIVAPDVIIKKLFAV